MIKIAICEDNRIEQTILKNLLLKVLADRHVPIEIKLFSSGEELLKQYLEESFDLIFLDIYMSELNGIEAGKKIRQKDVEVEVVYCTSSVEFVMASYEVFALGYLLKPFDIKRIETVVDFYLQKKPIEHRKCIIAKLKDAEYTIRYENILYVESIDKVVVYHTINNEDIRIYEKLGNIEESLKDPRFLRCNQSYIVNMDYIIKRENADFVMKNEDLIPIRKRGRKQLIDFYKEYMQRK